MLAYITACFTSLCGGPYLIFSLYFSAFVMTKRKRIRLCRTEQSDKRISTTVCTLALRKEVRGRKAQELKPQLQRKMVPAGGAYVHVS